MTPEHCPRRILLAVSGLTPQVVTETLYALAVQQRDRPFVPTEIHLVTTQEGAQRAQLGLLDPDQGRFHAFCSDYGLAGHIDFRAANIHVLPDASGEGLVDIRSEADNEAAADHLTELVRGFTADPAAAVHASLAGGRKTLGVYLGLALSLFGRPQDRLSHVLVSEPFESEPQFFYPPPSPRVLFLAGGHRPVRTDEAQIALAHIPFVRLRAGLPEALGEGRRSYSEVVRSLQAAMGPVRLGLDPANRRVRCGGAILELAPRHMALMAWLARRRAAGEGPIRWAEAPVDEFLAEYAAIEDELSHSLEQARRRLRGTDPEDRTQYFRENCSGLNRVLRDRLGEWSETYRVHALGERPHTVHGLTLEPERIAFEPIPEVPEP